MNAKHRNSPLVTVVTRTKDRTILLERTLKSVHAQTMTDFVHVVVNDGGDPKAVEKLISKLPEKFQARIKLVHNETSLGLTPALNQGINASVSKYIAILDDDDTWDEHYLELTTGHLEHSGSKGVVTVIDKVEEVIEGDKIRRLSTDRWRPDITAITLYGQCLDNYAPTVAFVYQRDVYDELGGYDESLGVAEDWEFTLRFLLKYDVDFLNTDHALAFYHHRPTAVGPIGNSVFAGVDSHKYHLNMLANRFLRKDIQEGKMGVGYIMNSLRYQRDFIMPRDVERQNKQTVRLEGHINYATKQSESAVMAYVREMQTINRISQKVKRLFGGEK